MGARSALRRKTPNSILFEQYVTATLLTVLTDFGFSYFEAITVESLAILECFAHDLADAKQHLRFWRVARHPWDFESMFSAHFS